MVLLRLGLDHYVLERQVHCLITILPGLSPVSQSEILGHPIHNHVLAEDECLSPPVTVARLQLKTTSLDDIEVSQDLHNELYIIISVFLFFRKSNQISSSH